ncbi:MAG: flagellar biosynthetic protein FliO [Lachnospiraceae bacterium]|nr:flagellar biosynthetic protein FliO [Lachnospiraceae bacterium]
MILALNNSSAGSFVQFFTVFVLFVFVLAICALTTRFVAGYQKNKMMSGNIHVLETYKIATNKYIQIVKIGDKLFALGIGKDAVTMLGELNEDSISINESDTTFQNVDFKSMLEKAKNFKFKK